MIYSDKKTDSVIIFVHIPKTGGCTLNSIIENQYNSSYKKFQMYPGSEKVSINKYIHIGPVENLAVVLGHVYYGIHEILPQKHYDYITLIRNPVELVLSLYYYILSQPNNYYYDRLKNMSLLEFIDSDIYAPNLQTRRLEGSNRDNIELASYNLRNNFSFVGVTDRFEESIQVLNCKFKWNVVNYQTNNVTVTKPALEEIDPYIISLIREQNTNDFKLYNLANEILNKNLEYYQLK